MNFFQLADTSRCVALMAVHESCAAPPCSAMSQFWHHAADRFPNLWFVSCEDEPAACTDFPQSVTASEPLVLLWNAQSSASEEFEHLSRVCYFSESYFCVTLRILCRLFSYWESTLQVGAVLGD